MMDPKAMENAYADLFSRTNGYDVSSMNAHVLSVANEHDVCVYALSGLFMDRMEQAEADATSV